jgi:hypothetical protein
MPGNCPFQEKEEMAKEELLHVSDELLNAGVDFMRLLAAKCDSFDKDRSERDLSEEETDTYIELWGALNTQVDLVRLLHDLSAKERSGTNSGCHLRLVVNNK